MLTFNAQEAETVTARNFHRQIVRLETNWTFERPFRTDLGIRSRLIFRRASRSFSFENRRDIGLVRHSNVAETITFS